MSRNLEKLSGEARELSHTKLFFALGDPVGARYIFLAAISNDTFLFGKSCIFAVLNFNRQNISGTLNNNIYFLLACRIAPIDDFWCILIVVSIEMAQYGGFDYGAHLVRIF